MGAKGTSTFRMDWLDLLFVPRWPVMIYLKIP